MVHDAPTCLLSRAESCTQHALRMAAVSKFSVTRLFLKVTEIGCKEDPSDNDPTYSQIFSHCSLLLVSCPFFSSVPLYFFVDSCFDDACFVPRTNF